MSSCSDKLNKYISKYAYFYSNKKYSEINSSAFHCNMRANQDLNASGEGRVMSVDYGSISSPAHRNNFGNKCLSRPRTSRGSSCNGKRLF